MDDFQRNYEWGKNPSAAIALEGALHRFHPGYLVRFALSNSQLDLEHATDIETERRGFGLRLQRMERLFGSYGGGNSRMMPELAKTIFCEITIRGKKEFSGYTELDKLGMDGAPYYYFYGWNAEWDGGDILHYVIFRVPVFLELVESGKLPQQVKRNKGRNDSEFYIYNLLRLKPVDLDALLLCTAGLYSKFLPSVTRKVVGS